LYGTNSGEWYGLNPFPSGHMFRDAIRLLFVDIARLIDPKFGLKRPGSEQPAHRLVPDGTLESADRMGRTDMFGLPG